MSSAICFNLDQSKILSSGNGLSLSSIYTHFNTFKEKSFKKNYKQISPFFHNAFNAICILKYFNATFQLSSAASLNLGWSQNGVLGNGLINKVSKLQQRSVKIHNGSLGK